MGEYRKILANMAKCRICGDVIESHHTHDFVTCQCGNLSVDGGVMYLKRTVRDGADSWNELSKFGGFEDA